MTADPGFVHLHVHSSYSLLEGALTIAQAGRARQGRPAAGAGADRHRQLFGALEFSEKLAGAASSRSSAVRWRSISAIETRDPQACRTRAGAAAASCCSPRREAGYRNLMRLSLARLSRDPGERAAASASWPGSTAHDRRPDRAHRRPGRAARSGDRAPGRRRSRRRALRRAAAAVRRPALCRTAAPRHCRTSAPPRRALIDLAYAQRLPLVATNEPFFATRRRLRGA